MLQDLRFAYRLIAKEPWFSAAAIVTLALGIGVNALGFTLVNAAFFRGLPFEDSGRLYMLLWQNRSGRRSHVSHAEFQDWRDQSRAFAALAAFSNGAINISDDRALPERARGSWVTANTFGVLRQQPLLGRDFAPGEDRLGAEPVVIIGYNIWKNRYDADPNVLGKSLRVNGQPATIIGVMLEGMRFPNYTDVWVPFIPADPQESRTVRRLAVFGRLRDGAVRGEAQTEVNGIVERLMAAYPDMHKGLVRVRVETFPERFVDGVLRTMYLALMGGVGFVLLIACANVANLLLSRSVPRAREMALRMALGATRWRVIRQLLLESVVLGTIGGGIGLVLADAGARAWGPRVGDPGGYWITFTVDYVVFGYVAAICVLTAALSGLAPALHVSKTNNNDLLKEGGRGSAGTRRARWFSGTIVVTELALTVVLLAGAGLMMRSFLKLYAMDIGIRTDGLMTMRLELPDSTYANPEARRGFYERLEPRLASIPGVEAAAVTTSAPPADTWERPLEIDGPARTSEERSVRVPTVTIGPGFFEVVNVRLRRGRTFDERDGAPGSETVIINERMASRFFPAGDPIGRRIRFPERELKPGQPAPVWRTIVGISPSIRHGAPQDAEPDPVVYLPYRQDPPAFAYLLVRSGLPPSTIMDAVRREVQAIDPDQPVFRIQTLEQMMALERQFHRIVGTLFASVAVIGLVLSAIGLYAVMAYSVTQRTQEIGVRMAVGALGRQVSWLILKRGLVQLAIGLTIGLAGAMALGGVFRRALMQITPTDPVTFGAITILLAVVSIAACLVPARRATRVDPIVALRAE